MMWADCKRAGAALLSTVRRGVFFAGGVLLTAGAFLLVCVFLTACTGSFSYMPNAMMRHAGIGRTILEVREDKQHGWEDMSGWEEEAAWRRAYLYAICNMQEYLNEPYGDRSHFTDSDFMERWVYLGLHDFDGDGMPELLIGDTTAIAVLTFNEGRIKRFAHADGADMAGFTDEIPEEAKEKVCLLQKESGWVLQFSTGEEAALDSEFDYALIQW